MLRSVILTIPLISWLAVACKSHQGRDANLKSVVTADPSDSGKLLIYYKDSGPNGNVYRKSCAAAQIATPSACATVPSNAARPWGDYQDALLSQGLTPVLVNGVKEALESSTAWDSGGQADLVAKLDKAFNVDVSSSANPFNRAFVGTPSSGAAAIPTTSTTTMVLANDLVLTEMQDALEYFRIGATTYRGARHPFPADAMVSSTVISNCYANASSISRWSDVVFYYYCQLGNLRTCFTGQVRSRPSGYDGYKEGFDYCLANDADFKRYFNGTLAGVDYPRRRAVFQHVIFSVYSAGGPNLFKRSDQDEVINRFFGVTSAANCSLRENLPRPTSDPLYRATGSHCGLTPSAPPSPPPSTGGGTVTNLTSWGGVNFYLVQVAGVMTDDNVRAACTAAGKKVPCNNAPNGDFSDTLCVDAGLRDRNNPMATISMSLCTGQLPDRCPPLKGVYQYMGNKFVTGSSCGVESAWCSAGYQYTNRKAICTD